MTGTPTNVRFVKKLGKLLEILELDPAQREVELRKLD